MHVPSKTSPAKESIASADSNRLSESFLLCLAKVDPDQTNVQQAIEIAGQTDFCWTHALDLAARHRMDALVAHNLAQIPELLQAAERLILQARWLGAVRARSRYTQFEKALHSILSQMSAASIPILLLKGASLMQTLISPDHRLLNDLDLWIPKQHLARAHRILTDAGFTEQPHPWMADDEVRDRYHQITFLKMVGQVQLGVDLHWRIYRVGHFFALNAPAFAARADEAQFAQVPVSACCKEDLFVHLATQLLNDQLTLPLQRVSDLHLLTHNQLDWNTVIARAREAGAIGACELATAVIELLGPIAGAGYPRSSGVRRVAVAILARPEVIFGRVRLRSFAKACFLTALLDTATQRRTALKPSGDGNGLEPPAAPLSRLARLRSNLLRWALWWWCAAASLDRSSISWDLIRRVVLQPVHQDQDAG